MDDKGWGLGIREDGGWGGVGGGGGGVKCRLVGGKYHRQGPGLDCGK